jgi:tetratricopeptide (TPR) repeat protein
VIDRSHSPKFRYALNSRLAVAGFLICQFYSLAAVAQAPAGMNPQGGMGNVGNRMGDVTFNTGDRRLVVVTVLNQAKAHLDRQAVIKLHDDKRDMNMWQTTGSESQSTFYDLDYGDYDIEVNAVGYLTGHAKLHVMATLETLKTDVVLQRDPTAIDLNATDDVLSGNASKEAKRAVYALKSGNLKDAERRLDKVYKIAPARSQVNFLLGYLFVQRADLEKAESYLSRAVSIDPRKVPALTLLGRVQLQRNQDAEAEKTLEKAVVAAPDQWMGHNLLADAYLRLKQYEKARQQAQLSIDQGKDAASAAQLVLGQALADLGRDQEGVQALRSFLKSNTDTPTTQAVRALIAQIEQRDAPHPANQPKAMDDLALLSSRPSLPAAVWGPPGIDDVKPSVAAGVSCPYDQIMEMSGARVKQLANDVGEFAATEDLLHERLDEFGNPVSKETRKFDYVASISEPQRGFLSVDEYRNERYGLYDLPDHIVTSGFVALALIFHPDMRDNFKITCEGLGQWQNQATWIMHFEQRDDKPNHIQNYVFGAQSYPVKLKGRAWITADKFEIVRIESELMSPLPGLSVQHQIVEYGPIHFHKQDVDLWLPKSVDLYLQYNRHRYFRRHSFDHYMLFSVKSEDKQVSQNKKPGSVVAEDPPPVTAK